MVSIHAGMYVIQSLEPHHVPAFTEFLLRNRQYFKPYEPRRPEYYFTAVYWQNINSNNKNDAIQRYVVVNPPDEIIGYINLSGVSGYPAYSCSLGYSLDRRYWRMGIMTAVLSRFVGYLFDSCNIHRIEAAYMPSNTASGRVLEKLGFEREGYAKEYLYINGAWEDHICTALVSPFFTVPSLDLPGENMLFGKE